MRVKSVPVAIVVLLFSAGSDLLLAGGANEIRADIPFTFTAGNETFPAGSYEFELSDANEPSLLVIRTPDGRRHEFLLTVADHARRGPADVSTLVFDTYGQDRFLSELWLSGFDEGRAVPKAEIQRVRAQQSRHEQITVSPGKKG